MWKLPEIFGSYFIREGVVTAVRTLVKAIERAEIAGGGSSPLLSPAAPTTPIPATTSSSSSSGNSPLFSQEEGFLRKSSSSITANQSNLLSLCLGPARAFLEKFPDTPDAAGGDKSKRGATDLFRRHGEGNRELKRCQE